MATNRALGPAGLAMIIGAFILSACGGSTPSATPAAVVTAGPTVAPVVTQPPTPAPTSTPVPTEVPTPVPTLTAAPKIDPADGLAIAAPYTLEPLDKALADVFVTAMEESMGALADVFHIGVRSAVLDGDTKAWVIVMAFPDLPISGSGLLDGAAAGVADGGDVEKRKILGNPVRIVETGGLFAVLTIVDDKLIFAMADGKTRAVNIVTAIIEASQ